VRKRLAFGVACGFVAVLAIAQSRRPPPIPSSDLLILRAGKRVQGPLKVCDSEGCVLGGKSYARLEIAWIGLAPPTTTPPKVVNPSEDEVHLEDGSVHKGELIGVSLGLVEIQSGSWDRDDAKWIHLAGAPAAPSEGGAIKGEEAPSPDKGGSASDPAKSGGGDGGSPNKGGSDKTGAGDKTSGDRPPKPPPTKTSGKRGGLWSGQIVIHFRLTTKQGGSTDEKTEVAARLREYRYPLIRPSDGKPYGTLVALSPEDTEIRTKYTSDSQGESAGVHCQGSGTMTQTVPAASALSGGSSIWINNTASDTTPWIGFPILRGSPVYVISTPHPEETFTVDCLAWQINAGQREETPSSEQESYYLAGFGKSPLGCPAFLKHVCDPQIRTIQGENGRMSGSFQNQWDEYDMHHSLEVRWSLCRDDVPCTTAPPEPEKNPCGGTAAEDALLNTCKDAEGVLVNQMVAKLDRYNESKAKALPHQAAFMEAIGACAGWDAAQLAIKFLLAVDAPGIGLTAAEAAELKEFVSTLKTINRLLAAITSDSATKALDLGKVDSLLKAVDTIKTFFETFAVLDKGEPEKFLEHLDECNAPLSPDMRKSAQDYLFEMQRALEEVNGFKEIGNDLRTKQNECLNKQFEAYRACVENARCKGTPESACDSKKPPGNWPGIP
jgi:hypothetical protein